eukprot:4781735-Amphidinium_carterae.1
MAYVPRLLPQARLVQGGHTDPHHPQTTARTHPLAFLSKTIVVNNNKMTRRSSADLHHALHGFVRKMLQIQPRQLENSRTSKTS